MQCSRVCPSGGLLLLDQIESNSGGPSLRETVLSNTATLDQIKVKWQMFCSMKELVWLQHSNANTTLEFMIIISFLNLSMEQFRMSVCVFCWGLCSVYMMLCKIFFTSGELAFNVKHCKFLTCLLFIILLLVND